MVIIFWQFTMFQEKLSSRFDKRFKTWELRKLGNIKIISKLGKHCLVSSFPSTNFGNNGKKLHKSRYHSYSSLVLFCLIKLIFAKYFVRYCKRKTSEKFFCKNFPSCVLDKMFIASLFHETPTALKNFLLSSRLTTINAEKRTSVYLS